MSTAAPIVLILGSGSNRMQAAARVFHQLNIAGDLSDPDVVVGAFSKVKEVLGDHPSVIVDNGENFCLV
ncbi:hypothetical protein B0J13DRAFT_631051 [Dactylonectria estremocensis]|uniref:Uncharacterized protein n=1 Tax=Dactylonectria estremocensis TaxID=1079267 RepID=A0A9P9D7U6_9HYPO|nr:hypothetical protein B0J13DRAFT_631051 [Dactylonectria estremocensis]